MLLEIMHLLVVVKLGSITLPDGINTIGDYAFDRCSKLANIVFSSSLTSIGDAAFYACSSLTNIIFPSSLVSIGFSAFFNCDALINITLKRNETPLTTLGINSINKAGLTIYFPQGSVYQSLPNWRDLTNATWKPQ